MKRTPLSRKTPLQSKTPLRSKSTLQQTSTLKADPDKTREWQNKSAIKAAIARQARARESKTYTSIKPGKSEKRRDAEARYAPIAKDYLARNPFCHHCLELGRTGSAIKPSTEVHHIIGKVGEDRFDTRFFLALYSVCHTIDSQSVEANQADARARGWIIDRTWTKEAQLATLLEKRGHLPYVQFEIEKYEAQT